MAFSGPLRLFQISNDNFFSEIVEKQYYCERGMVPIFGLKNGQTSALYRYMFDYCRRMQHCTCICLICTCICLIIVGEWDR